MSDYVEDDYVEDNPRKRWGDRFRDFANRSELRAATIERRYLGVPRYSTLVGEATQQSGFRQALQAYRAAKKIRVCRDVTRERRRTVESWDSYSTSCAGWYYTPIGCPTTRTISEPYTVKQCEMQFPADLENPRQAPTSHGSWIGSLSRDSGQPPGNGVL
ncbi:MAG: hypothetical protein ACR2FJ_08595 [Qipengyuania sp.]